MKLRLPKTRRFRVYLYMLSILIILLAADLVAVRIGRHITIAYDTTRITSPLQPDGMPDYLQAMEEHCSAGVTRDNNAAPLLLEIMATQDDYGAHRAAICARLGMPVPTVSDRSFISQRDFEQRENASERDSAILWRDSEDVAYKTWRSTDYPRLAAWVHANDKALDAFQAATMRPRCFMPYVLPGNQRRRDDFYFVLGFEPLTYISRAALARATLRIGMGDFDSARADLLAVHRLALLVAQSPFLTARHLAGALASMASRADLVLANQTGLTAQQARRFLADLGGLPSFPDPGEAVDLSERYSVLDTLIRAARGRPSTIINERGDENSVTTVLHIRLLLDYSPANFNAALRRANGYFDAQVAACREPTYRQGRARAEAADAQLYALRSTLAFDGYLDPADFLLCHGVPSADWTLRIHAYQSVTFDLTRLAFALAAYHADRQVYPDALAALTPDYLPSIPNDFFIGAPLHYVKTPQGYILYSVGSNMTDDGGHDRDHPTPAHRHPDDIVVLVGPHPEQPFVARESPTTKDQ